MFRDPREDLRYCAICDMKFDGDTMFAEINGERICDDCLSRMDYRELLERLEVEFDCIGFPEDERSY